MHNNSRTRRRRGKSFNSEINITPFVDVLLVILIIFMVTAPMLESGFDVSLPKSSPNALANAGVTNIIVTLDRAGGIYMENKKYNLGQFENKIKSSKKETQIFLKADRDARYQEIITVMSRLKNLGFLNISLVTEVE